MAIMATAPTIQEYERQNRFIAVFSGFSTGPDWFETNLLEFRPPSLSVTKEEIWDGTVYNRIFSKAAFSSFALSFYVAIGTDPFYTWIDQHVQHNGLYQAAIVHAVPLDSSTSYKKTIMVNILDGLNNTLDKWIFYGCQMNSATIDAFSMVAQGDVVKASIELEADRIITPTNAKSLGLSS